MRQPFPLLGRGWPFSEWAVGPLGWVGPSFSGSGLAPSFSGLSEKNEKNEKNEKMDKERNEKWKKMIESETKLEL